MSYTQRGATESAFAVCGMSATGSNKQVDVFPVSWINTSTRVFPGRGLIWGTVPPTDTAVGAIGCSNQQITDARNQWGGAWSSVATAKAVSDDAFVTWGNGVSWEVKSAQFGYPNNVDAVRSRIVVLRMQAP
jgi:hypothetical protein